MEKFAPAEKKAAVEKVPVWYHSIDLGNGIVTPGKSREETRFLRASAIPENLKGKTVLDVGAWDGYYSFECEKRGAKVFALEKNHVQGFYAAREILNSKAKLLEIDFFELPKVKRQFDIVLFFGVLYHLKYPLKALEILFEKTNELLILESHFIRTLSRKPVMRFYPGSELCKDGSNWWGPNIKCILEMLKTAGFEKAEVYKTYRNWLCRGRVIIKAFKQ